MLLTLAVDPIFLGGQTFKIPGAELVKQVEDLSGNVW